MIVSPPDNEAIFHAARDIPDPGRRREYVRQACGEDATRIAHIEAMLAAAEVPDSLLDHPAGSDPVATIDRPTTERPGTVIGLYKLLEEIGEGGMGTVWMAQQTEPVKRLVAVKLIKPGMDTRQVLARFEAERQALALMDHPNIARVLDGGTTSAGRPYFVMDLVKGMPITRYCDEHRLTPRQRLELFLPVCQAVQHAHQKGIIHRDLKPSNVLAALSDDRAVPKVIDFGVAKATGQLLTEKTLVTGFGAIVGTLEYMSPEQAESSQLDIDTRSDIYSLGVLLYELLTGSPPFTRKELAKAGMLEMLRVIREQEPSKPSTKLSTADGLPTLAANRGTEPTKLTKLVRGELDWIVMKALEKDRSRRYETANGFGMDIQRYLADEPVQACPPSVGYRCRKFVRRNKGPVVAATLVLVALVSGIIGTSWQAVRAEQARQAEQERAEGEARERKRAEIARFDGTTGAYLNDFVPVASGGLGAPSAHVFGPSGRSDGALDLYVSDDFTGNILRYDGTTGAFLGVFVPNETGGLGAPTGLMFGPDGNLYVSDAGYFGSAPAVLRFQGPAGATPGAFMGAFVSAGSGGLLQPFGVLFGPDRSGDGQQDLYVTSADLHESSFKTSRPHASCVKVYDGVTGGYLSEVISVEGGGLNTPILMTFTETDPVTLAYLGGVPVAAALPAEPQNQTPSANSAHPLLDEALAPRHAAGWGWFVDPTPGHDSEFSTPGHQGEQARMDPLTLTAGTWQEPESDARLADWTVTLFTVDDPASALTGFNATSPWGRRRK
jgi:serine/threonine protein kinase